MEGTRGAGSTAGPASRIIPISPHSTSTLPVTLALICCVITYPRQGFVASTTYGIWWFHLLSEQNTCHGSLARLSSPDNSADRTAQGLAAQRKPSALVAVAGTTPWRTAARA